MNKEDFAQLHYLLAKLKYELLMDKYECEFGSEYIKELEKEIEAIDTIMQVFVVDMG